MAKQTINLGTVPNDRTGDKLRDAFDKCNDNFTELYTGATSTAPATPTAGTAIDLTKRIHALNGAAYTLANGSEGQILYFVPVTGSTGGGNTVLVANGRYLAEGTATVSAAVPFAPFASNDAASVVTMIFTQGAWQASSGTWGA